MFLKPKNEKNKVTTPSGRVSYCKLSYVILITQIFDRIINNCQKMCNLTSLEIYSFH
jgi:hypothetical protein